MMTCDSNNCTDAVKSHTAVDSRYTLHTCEYLQDTDTRTHLDDCMTYWLVSQSRGFEQIG